MTECKTQNKNKKKTIDSHLLLNEEQREFLNNVINNGQISSKRRQNCLYSFMNFYLNNYQMIIQNGEKEIVLIENVNILIYINVLVDLFMKYILVQME